MSEDQVALLRPPPEVIRIAERLESAGFETWCVGGAVRDALLGHPHLDWDLATAATPPQVRKLFRRTVPIGIDFGTVGVLDPAGVMHEVTTFRRDVTTDGRHAVVEFGASLDDDLARRDFTINAIAFSPTRRLIHDPFTGRADIRRGVVRAVGDAGARMREDRLRALRAIRFAARFGFAVDPGTWQAVLDSAPHLKRLSAERVKQELEKTMEQVDRPSVALRLWAESGALRTLIPELSGVTPLVLASLDALPRASHEPIDELARGRADRRTLARLTALFADLPPAAARAALRALRFSRATAMWIESVVGRWQTIAPAVEQALLNGSPPAAATVRRWVAISGRTMAAAVLRLGAARFAAARQLGERAPSASSVASLHRRALRAAFRDAVEIGDLAVDGNDLAEVGVSPGPEVGRILRLLLDAVLEDQSLNTRDGLLARARQLHERSSGSDQER